MTSVTVGAPHAHVEDPDTVGRRWRVGVLLLILADAAFVGALVFSYFYLRGLNTEQAWLADGQDTAVIWVGWAIAAGAVLSALVFRWARDGIRAGDESRFVAGTLVALVVVLADAIGQVVQIASFPFGVDASAYSSSMYVLAGANLFHLVVTSFIGLAMWNRGRQHIYTQSSHWQVELVWLWWGWIAIAATIGAFATSFIASPNIGG